MRVPSALVLVGVVEAAALEGDGHGGVDLMNLVSLALRAFGQRTFREGALNGEVIAAVLAAIVISRHWSSFAFRENILPPSAVWIALRCESPCGANPSRGAPRAAAERARGDG